MFLVYINSFNRRRCDVWCVFSDIMNPAVRTLVGVTRDCRGLALAFNNKSNYAMLFDIVYPSYYLLLIRAKLLDLTRIPTFCEFSILMIKCNQQRFNLFSSSNIKLQIIKHCYYVLIIILQISKLKCNLWESHQIIFIRTRRDHTYIKSKLVILFSSLSI